MHSHYRYRSFANSFPYREIRHRNVCLAISHHFVISGTQEFLFFVWIMQS